MSERISAGTVLKVDKLGTGITFTTIAGIASITGPSRTVTAIDVTVLADNVKRYRPGTVDNGEISFDLQFDPSDTEHLWLNTQFEGRTVNTYQIVVPAQGDQPAVECEFAGFLTAFDTSIGGVDEVNTGTCTIQLTSSPVYTEVE